MKFTHATELADHDDDVIIVAASFLMERMPMKKIECQ